MGVVYLHQDALRPQQRARENSIDISAPVDPSGRTGKAFEFTKRGTVPRRHNANPSSSELQGLISQMADGNTVAQELEVQISRISSFGNEAVPELTRLLTPQQSIITRESAGKALAKIGTTEAVTPLLEAIVAEAETDSRRILVSTLHLVDNREATMPLLETLLKTQDSITVTTVRDTLARLADDQTAARVVQTYHENAQEGWQQSNLLGTLNRIRNPQAVASLSKILTDDSDWAIRVQASISLGGIGNNAAVNALVTVLDQSPSSITSVAAESLGSVRNKDSLDQIIGLLESNHNEGVRYGAATALRNFRNERSLLALRRVLSQETSSLVRRAIEESLRLLNSVAVPGN